MSSPTIAKATHVDRAVERLEAAVQRLELAAEASGSDGGDAALRAEVERLRALNADVVTRVDSTIERLERLADEGGDD